MDFIQKEIRLKPYPRGFHLITRELLHQLPEIKRWEIGMISVFIKHTSAGLTINENADPTVRSDFEAFFNQAVAENNPHFKHTFEGPDDMPAHIKSSLLGHQVAFPIKKGQPNLGIWQGVYLCEHRNRASGRSIVITGWGKIASS